METARIAQILDEMGTLLEVRGENPFRCRAYHNAAQALRLLPADLSEMIADGSLAEVPGIGETMLQQDRRARDDRPSARLRGAPAGDAAGPGGPVAGAGPGPEEDQDAARRRSRSRAWPTSARRPRRARSPCSRGSAPRPQAKILEGITLHRVGRRPDLAEPGPAAGRADHRGGPAQHPGVIRAEVCGSLRRRAETIGDLDILFSADDPAPVLDRVRQAARGGDGPGARADQGERPAGRRRAVRPAGRRRRAVPVRPALLHRARRRTTSRCGGGRMARGCTLNEYALEGPDGPVACRTEADLFAALGLAEIPPELREDAGEIEAAERGPLPRLVERRRPDRHVPLPHRLERRRRHARGDGRGGPRRRAEVPGDRRPLAVGRLRRGPDRSSGSASSGRRSTR